MLYPKMILHICELNCMTNCFYTNYILKISTSRKTFMKFEPKMMDLNNKYLIEQVLLASGLRLLDFVYTLLEVSFHKN